ncbi:MAG: type II secretion system F family protein [Fuerstiella sp.]|nr:type II secretion system F family protein [Fuerstiella sp.]
MNSEFIIPIAVFTAVMCAVWAVISVFTKNSSRTAQRLEEMRDPWLRRGPDSDNGKMNNIIDKAAPTLSKALDSGNEEDQSKLKIRLANAGYSHENAPRNFLAIKMVSLVLGLIFGGVYGIASVESNSWMAWIIGAGLGFYVPEMILTMMKMSRQTKIFLQLPDALDLLVVCVEAGLGLDAGMRRVSQELVSGAPEVCQELGTANMQLQMGKPRRQVLHDLGIRTGVDDMRALAAILIQADRFGSSIAHALRVQSDSMRVKRRQMAEEKAQATAVKMIFPLVLFIFPGIFVVLVGPAGIQLMENLINK